VKGQYSRTTKARSFFFYKYVLAFQTITIFLDGSPNYQCLDSGSQITTF